MRELSVCVFCGFSGGNEKRYLDSGRELGALLAERGHRLIYGGSGRGLMGAVAEEAARWGGDVVGVVPRFLRHRERADVLPPQELILTDDLFDRKRTMIERADGFIALPGGYGTLDEVVEVISMIALRVLHAPVALVDVGGVWAPFVALVDNMHRRGFLQDTELFAVTDGPAAALEHIERHAAYSVPPVGVEPTPLPF